MTRVTIQWSGHSLQYNTHEEMSKVEGDLDKIMKSKNRVFTVETPEMFHIINLDRVHMITVSNPNGTVCVDE